jgi:hypothetical protein
MEKWEQPPGGGKVSEPWSQGCAPSGPKHECGLSIVRNQALLGFASVTFYISFFFPQWDLLTARKIWKLRCHPGILSRFVCMQTLKCFKHWSFPAKVQVTLWSHFCQFHVFQSMCLWTFLLSYLFSVSISVSLLSLCFSLSLSLSLSLFLSPLFEV